MPKNVESSIRNVGHQPGDLDEIAGNIQEKTLCRLPGCLHGYVSLNTPKKREKKLAKLRDLCIYLLYGRQWSNVFYFVSVNMTKLSLVYLWIIKTCCPCPYFNAWKPSSAVISICTHTVNFMECNGWQWREIHGWHSFILFFDRALKAASVTYSMWKIAVNLTWVTISRLYDLCQFLYPPNYISIY